VCILLFSIPVFAGNEDDAIQHATLAAYKQFGLENIINATIDNNIPKNIKTIFEKINPVITAVTIKRIEIVWNF
jgi:hypothetical protein